MTHDELCFNAYLRNRLMSFWLSSLLTLMRPFCEKQTINSNFHELFHDGSLYHIETRPLICTANQRNGIYMIGSPSWKIKADVLLSVLTILYHTCDLGASSQPLLCLWWFLYWERVQIIVNSRRRLLFRFVGISKYEKKDLFLE